MPVLRGLLSLLLLHASLVAVAHGLLLDAESDGESIFGSAYYSNGEKAGNEPVSLRDLTTPDAQPISATTDAAGDFRFDVVRSHRYRVSVYGDEGHSVEIEVIAEPQSLPRLIESESSTAASLWPPPAWAVIGGVLLLSLVPAIVMRRRNSCVG